MPEIKHENGWTDTVFPLCLYFMPWVLRMLRFDVWCFIFRRILIETSADNPKWQHALCLTRLRSSRTRRRAKEVRSALKGEAVRSSETLVSTYQTTRRHVPANRNHIMTCIPIARQRLGNTIPGEPTRTRIGRPSLGNESVNSPP
jgi:hypothetical protein